MRPHRRQPTRLPRPWDSPGKNIGVGCHFLLQGMKVKSESEVAQSCPTLRNLMDCSLPSSSVHGIFQARVLEWVAIAFSLTEIKHKERILKAARDMQQVTYKEKPIWLIADLTAETLQAWREWQDTFKELKEKILLTRLLPPQRSHSKLMGKSKALQTSKS